MVDEADRFQEMQDIDKESILYAMASTKNNVKGILVNAYSVLSPHHFGIISCKTFTEQVTWIIQWNINIPHTTIPNTA
jgi:hypothetical protein